MIQRAQEDATKRSRALDAVRRDGLVSLPRGYDVAGVQVCQQGDEHRELAENYLLIADPQRWRGVFVSRREVPFRVTSAMGSVAGCRGYEAACAPHVETGASQSVIHGLDPCGCREQARPLCCGVSNAGRYRQ